MNDIQRQRTGLHATAMTNDIRGRRCVQYDSQYDRIDRPFLSSSAGDGLCRIRSRIAPVGSRFIDPIDATLPVRLSSNRLFQQYFDLPFQDTSREQGLGVRVSMIFALAAQCMLVEQYLFSVTHPQKWDNICN
jgi:hypothetical protein